MPESELEYDAEGKVVGCHYAHQDEAHQLIEEFMLTANEAVAGKLADVGVAFLRRIHPPPDALRLKAFADFVRSLGVELEDYRSRFELQRILKLTENDPRRAAIHYALLRSLKEAYYGPEDEGHFALASEDYCHFTSPIRRYPDLTVHRLLDGLIRRGKAGSAEGDLVALGEQCSGLERRAAKAERELKKLKLLDYMATRIGDVIPMVVTGVEDFGVFAQGVEVPAEGLVHVRNLPPDAYRFDRSTMTLAGRREGNAFRLGDKIDCIVTKVDRELRSIDLRIAPGASHQAAPKLSKSAKGDRPRGAKRGGSKGAGRGKAPRKGKRRR
jgi:ribonuclease R